MVYTVNLKWAAFKQDISSLDKMIDNQIATYAILRYAQDIPDAIYKKAMNLLAASVDTIMYRKLAKLVKSYCNVAKVGLVMDEEFVETIEIPVGQADMLTMDTPRGYSLMIEESDED